jgi:hypothetical protein
MTHRHVAIIAESHRHARAASEAMMHQLVVHQKVEVSGDREGRFRVIDHEAGMTTWVLPIPTQGAHLALEGARFDEIVIAGDYLRWNMPSGNLTYLWQTIVSTIMRAPLDTARVTFL